MRRCGARMKTTARVPRVAAARERSRGVWTHGRAQMFRSLEVERGFWSRIAAVDKVPRL